MGLGGLRGRGERATSAGDFVGFALGFGRTGRGERGEDDERDAVGVVRNAARGGTETRGDDRGEWDSSHRGAALDVAAAGAVRRAGSTRRRRLRELVARSSRAIEIV